MKRGEILPKSKQSCDFVLSRLYKVVVSYSAVWLREHPSFQPWCHPNPVSSGVRSARSGNILPITPSTNSSTSKSKSKSKSKSRSVQHQHQQEQVRSVSALATSTSNQERGGKEMSRQTAVLATHTLPIHSMHVHPCDARCMHAWCFLISHGTHKCMHTYTGTRTRTRASVRTHLGRGCPQHPAP